jgi:hypothetical protein
MRAEKLEQLTALLKAIPPDKAVALARAVETMRRSDPAGFPAKAVLDALAPALATARRKRSALQPMTCVALEPFLVENDSFAGVPGLIARSTIAPWWDALRAAARPVFASLQAELDRLVPTTDDAALDALAIRVRAAAATGTAELIELMKGKKPSPTIKALARHPERVADIQQIGEILQAGEPLRAAIAELVDIADDYERTAGTMILDLSPAIVTEAKRIYDQLSEGGGVETKLFVLAILNRLDKPWHIFRLARALSWQRDATMVAHSELAVIGQRLLHYLDLMATMIDAANPRGRMSSHLVDFDRLRELVGRYVECAEGMLGEIDLRRDSEWGEAILRSRGKMRDTFEEDRMETAAEAILAIIPDRDGRQRGAAKPVAAAQPSEAVVAHGLKAIQLLTFLSQRAGRQGFSAGARKVLDELGHDIQKRAENLIADLRAEPGNAGLRELLAPRQRAGRSASPRRARQDAAAPPQQ